MRVFTTVQEAISEVQRDVYKGSRVSFTRVQQRDHLDIPGRERLSYNYAIEPDGIPDNIEDLVKLGAQSNFPAFVQHPEQMELWLANELAQRLGPEDHLGHQPADFLNPALGSTAKEGNHFSYTYRERLMGSVPALISALVRDPDTRRAYWPIYVPQDAIRSASPTRIPCSIGYQALLRRQDGRDRLILVYLQRSSDFDQFWLTDLWFANQFQKHLSEILTELRRRDGVDEPVLPGLLVHYIISLHSFLAEGSEIY